MPVQKIIIFYSAKHKSSADLPDKSSSEIKYVFIFPPPPQLGR